MDDSLFSSDLWAPALDKYAEVTGLTVELFDVDERAVVRSEHPTPLVALFREYGFEPGLFAACARRCLGQTKLRPPVIVSESSGLTVVGTSLELEGTIVGAAVAGYAFAGFSQVGAVQRWAKPAGVPFDRLWDIARRQAPVPARRLRLHGELLQVLGDALLRENHRTRQYEDTVVQLQAAAAARERLTRQLELLSERLATAHEEERRKIAYALHEELAQELAAMKIYLQILGPGSGGAEADSPRKEALAVAAQALERVRNLVLDFDPSELDELGLYAAIQTYCQRQAMVGGWTMHIAAPKPDVRAPRDVERACFRVLHEGLSNVLRYAKAGEVWVDLRQGADELELAIRDDGIGFDRNADRGENGLESARIGLFGMQIRTQQAGGRLEVKSTPGVGTEVHAVFPLSVAP